MSLKTKLLMETYAARTVMTHEVVAHADSLYPGVVEKLRQEAAKGQRFAYVGVGQGVPQEMRKLIAAAILARLEAEGLTTTKEVEMTQTGRQTAYRVSW